MSEIISEIEFNAARLIVQVQDEHDQFGKMTYDQFVKVATELERLNTQEKGYAIVCLEDPSHNIIVRTRGATDYDGKTGEVIGGDTDDEWYFCTVDSKHKIVHFDDYENFLYYVGK